MQGSHAKQVLPEDKIETRGAKGNRSPNGRPGSDCSQGKKPPFYWKKHNDKRKVNSLINLGTPHLKPISEAISEKKCRQKKKPTLWHNIRNTSPPGAESQTSRSKKKLAPEGKKKKLCRF